MSSKSIEDFNPSLHACYAVTNITEDFNIFTVHPNGLKQYDDYDSYNIGNKTIIAFNKINLYGTEFVYRIISENYIEEINAENYESLRDVLDEYYDQSNYVFCIMNSTYPSEEVKESNNNFVDDSRRCDLQDFVATNFNDIIFDGKSTILDREYFNDQNIFGFGLFFASMGNIYILKLHLKDVNDRAYKDWPGCVMTCQTFMHAIKMAYEWNLLAQEPWNSTQTIAVKCNRAFNDWSMSQEVLEEIQNINPTTSIELFLSGDEDPRRSNVEHKAIPPLFKKWFMSRLRYRTLNSISKNYPENLDIPQHILDREIEFFENEIFSFCTDNYLNPLELTNVDIYHFVLNNENLNSKELHKNNKILDILSKMQSLNDDLSLYEYLENIKQPMSANGDLDA